MLTNTQILEVIKDLEKPDYNVHLLSDAWYSSHAILNAFGAPNEEPKVEVVRVSLKSGVLELHPREGGEVEILCYCCFSGSPERGKFKLENLREAVMNLKDHFCPPWPG
jgi:hypothetical protein